MKLLRLLCVAQTLAIVFLGVTVYRLADKIESPQVSLEQQAEPTSSSSIGYESRLYAMDSASLEQVRNTIRDEFRAQYLNHEANELNETELNQAENKTTEISTAEQIAAVSNSIEYHINAGEIGEYEMSSLQEKILRLDKTNRRAMFKKLFEALNNGQLKGYL